MKRELQITADGSHTIYVPKINTLYHSKFGAIQESMHVFIGTGLKHFLSLPEMQNEQPVKIFEMGFGTGLNTLLSLQEAIRTTQKIYYYGIELYPLEQNEWKQLNFIDQLNEIPLKEYFIQMHDCIWEKDIALHPMFILHKAKQSLENFSTDQQFDLIYFDAFDPNTQPVLWTKEIFEKIFSILRRGGILTTYCSKGSVRRTMMEAGFTVEKIPGPPGKREILRAKKI